LKIHEASQEIDNTSAILGFCKEQNKSQVDSYIAGHYVSAPDQGIKFLWSESANIDGNYYLYLLKHKAAMDKSDILRSDVKYDNTTGQQELMIGFNTGGRLLWQNLTKSNLGKSIAIVLDDKVYSAPKVMAEIRDGQCMIAGNFSSQEINRLKSLINNGELLLDFKPME
jgi:SecD/SecF fusion protein